MLPYIDDNLRSKVRQPAQSVLEAAEGAHCFLPPTLLRAGRHRNGRMVGIGDGLAERNSQVNRARGRVRSSAVLFVVPAHQ